MSAYEVTVTVLVTPIAEPVAPFDSMAARFRRDFLWWILRSGGLNGSVTPDAVLQSLALRVDVVAGSLTEALLVAERGVVFATALTRPQWRLEVVRVVLNPTELPAARQR
ncbi:hypothetical protein EEZ25_33240 [Micromonospora aurantiaca]|uniref:hypothetical protein n=1 Tax=Micromonospora aurantiaca (nom. illeg.) TaxID=47850 RepID=UPI000F3DE134|nr:hypothetical protein [Micromonospora aurantiaca]RNH93509.1 hypothetical protein EEZ25_33240 [Micromonospora aurantiaca]